MNWPISYEGQHVLGSSDSNNGICTLWSDREIVRENVSTDLFNIAGQCYGEVEGVSEIIRNCLANKKIGRIYVWGDDLSPSGDVLMSLKEEGDVRLRNDIPADAVARFRENVGIIDMRGKSLEELTSRLERTSVMDPWGGGE